MMAESQQQEQVQVPKEIQEKFEGHAQEFLDAGYNVKELEAAEIVHPTHVDPVAKIGNVVLGMWLH